MDQAVTHSWVASPTSAEHAARSHLRARLGNRRSWLFLAVLWAASGLGMALVTDEAPSSAGRAVWGFTSVTTIWVLVLPVVLWLTHRANRRRFGVRLAPGAELTSRFGPSSVELAGELSRSELAFADLEHVERVGGWVHLRQVGSPLTLVWPGELFPDHELDRMRQVVTERSRLG